MTEYKIGKATVRIHGTTGEEKIGPATEKFLKQVVIQRKKRGQKNEAASK